jgi:hypothetical protein
MVALKLGPKDLQAVLAKTEELAAEHGRLARMVSADNVEDAENFPDPAVWKAFKYIEAELDAQLAYHIKLGVAILALEKSLQQQLASLESGPSKPTFPRPNYAELFERMSVDPFSGTQ